jgi:hypothetical protein
MEHPQGSILGPLMFLIYINDYDRCLQHCKAIQFADDTSLYLSGRNNRKMFIDVNTDLVNTRSWLVANKLTLNISKSKFVVFRRPNHTNNTVVDTDKLFIGNETIEQVKYITFLGVIFHENLSWKLHIQRLISKLKSNSSVIIKIAPYLNQATLLLLYHSFILSHVRYCISTWCHGHSTEISRLQRLCNKFIRLIFGLHRRSSVIDIMKNNNLFTINQLSDLEIISFMCKYDRKKLPSALLNTLTTKNPLHSRSTRSNSKYTIPYFRTTLTQQSIKYKGPKLGASIPSEIRDNPKANQFFQTNEIVHNKPFFEETRLETIDETRFL